MTNQSLSVIFIDIDNLKTINDTYGHAAGDLALKNAASAMQGCIRAGLDWAARYGGDEFVICLNNVGNDEAELTAEKLRRSINALAIPTSDGSVGISASLGVQTMQEPVTAEEMLRLADEKMYEAKRSGKNPAR